MATKVSKDPSPTSTMKLASILTAHFREERFIDPHPNILSLIRIGEYVRTPLFEPSIRAMRLTLSYVRKQLDIDRKTNTKFDAAWKASTKMFQMRESFLKGRFKGPEEYPIALICYSLDEPYKIYEDFHRKCQQLMTDTWAEFPYKSLLYLLIQAETRMIIIDEEELGPGGDAKKKVPPVKKVKRPITITTDLDYSIEEEGESEEHDSSTEMEPHKSPTILHTSYPKLKQRMHRVFRGLNFQLDEKQFQPRTLVAFSHLLPTTLDGIRLSHALQERGRKGKRVTTLLEIDELSWSSRFVANLSVFPVEKEVIIWPWIKFYVEERKMIGDWLERVLLKPTSRSFLGNKEVNIEGII